MASNFSFRAFPSLSGLDHNTTGEKTNEKSPQVAQVILSFAHEAVKIGSQKVGRKSLCWLTLSLLPINKLFTLKQ